jgi:hypothetical protein
MNNGAILLIAAIVLIGVLIWWMVKPTNSSSFNPNIIRFGTILSGDQEVPPVTTIAKGEGQGILRDDDSTFHYDIIVTGLTPISAHFHLGRIGQNGPIVKTLSFQPVNINGISSYQSKGIWKPSDYLEPLTPDLLNDLKRGNIYVNYHTTDHPNGEIRGQIRPILS